MFIIIFFISFRKRIMYFLTLMDQIQNLNLLFYWHLMVKFMSLLELTKKIILTIQVTATIHLHLQPPLLNFIVAVPVAEAVCAAVVITTHWSRTGT